MEKENLERVEESAAPLKPRPMTNQQITALHFPCVEAEDTMNPRFYRTIADWHVCLTMNVGFE